MKPRLFNVRTWSALLGAAILAAGLTLVALRAFAEGVPADDALTYTGHLEDPDGTPVAGPVAIMIELWTAETGGKKACERSAEDVMTQSGRFQLTLPAECTKAVAANASLWTEVRVDGNSLGRTKLGAVPYALEAAHATTADAASSAQTAQTAESAAKAESAASADALTCPDPKAPGQYGFCIWLETKGAKNYNMTFSEAAQACVAKGARLCSLAEVSAAQAAGAEWCSYAFTADRVDQTTVIAAFPMQTASVGCGNTVGVLSGSRPMSQLSFANCCR